MDFGGRGSPFGQKMKLLLVCSRAFGATATCLQSPTRKNTPVVSVPLLSPSQKEQSFDAKVDEAKQGKCCVPSIYLLRHGAHADVGMRLTGRAQDGGLTDAGRAQVAAAIARLERAPPTAIFASPRRRTVETATLVAERFGLDVTTSPALDEINFGDWTGARFADLAGDKRWSDWNARRATARCPGGESQREAQARALAFAFEAAATSERPLLVTHCDIIRALLCWAERRSLDDIHSVQCEPGSLATLDLIFAEAAA